MFLATFAMFVPETATSMTRVDVVGGVDDVTAAQKHVVRLSGENARQDSEHEEQRSNRLSTGMDTRGGNPILRDEMGRKGFSRHCVSGQNQLPAKQPGGAQALSYNVVWLIQSAHGGWEW